MTIPQILMCKTNKHAYEALGEAIDYVSNWDKNYREPVIALFAKDVVVPEWFEKAKKYGKYCIILKCREDNFEDAKEDLMHRLITIHNQNAEQK